MDQEELLNENARLKRELSAVAFMLRNPLGIFVIFLGIAVAVFLIVYPHYHRPWIFSSLAPSAPAEPAVSQSLRAELLRLRAARADGAGNQSG